MSTKTYTPTAAEAEAQREWYVVDADGQTLGRLATLVAQYLRGKNKPTFSTHMDMGDFVIVINADKIKVTGNKNEQKMYYRHSGYIGNLKEIPFNEMLKKHPEFPIEEAVKGMLPRNTLGANMIKKLKVYAGGRHPHAAQRPKQLTIDSETGTFRLAQS